MKKLVFALIAVFSVGLTSNASAEGHEGLTVFKHSLSDCTPKDEYLGYCTQTAEPYQACMTYHNPNYVPLVCNLMARANFVERYGTGFTKEVLDVRQETIYYNSYHRVCFDFRKDAYHLWRLVKVGKPKVDCVDDGSGFEPCDPSTQSDCGQTPIIDGEACDPYDWDSDC